ncbi:MAG: insulinase family protein [Anaeromyxobacter sp.]|nr:insulinase family protein [Anaeromyxobacter sp.]MBL0276324.1 insulinase family protein [Anaeromyxobacter sp.]
MPTRLALALALVLAAAAAPAQEIPDIPFTTFRLQNGLTLVVHEDHKAPIVAVNVWYHVGSKNERPGRTGFAHLFEHLVFNGSEHFNDDYFKVLERLGATDMNGTTDTDRTNYFQNVPVASLDTVLWMESDRMGHLLGAIDQARLDEQRGVVQNEKRQRDNQPYGRVYDLMAPLQYPPGHPYSWTTIGSMEDLNAASLDDVKTWFKTWYGPSNATLVVAGDVKPEDVKARVERFFGDLPPGPPLDRPAVWVAKRTGEQRQELQDRVPQARVYLSWNTPEWGAPDGDLLDLAGQVLSSGKTSRLYKRLVYDEQIATSVMAGQWTRELGSSFMIVATVKPGGDPAAVERAARQELSRLIAQGPTKDEVARARTEQVAGFIRGVERIGGFGGKSDVLAENQVYGGDPGAYRARLQRALAATPAEIQGAARRWLSDGLHVMTVTPFPELAAGAGGADRSRRPEPGPQPGAALPALQRATLSNGLELVVAERHEIPVVTLDLVVDAGYASDAGGKAGTAKLAANMLDEGTRRRSALQLSEALQRLGAGLSSGSNLDQTTVSLDALKANLDASLDLFADVVLEPSFPQADFDRLQKQQAAAIGQELAQPNGVAMRVVPALIFGKTHPYGNPLTGSGTAASVASITRADVVAWHQAWFKPGGATLVVVGDTTLAEIRPKLERLLAGWKAGRSPKQPIGQGTPPSAGLYLIDRPGAPQSLILMGTVAPPRRPGPDVAQEVMNTILGGQFTSRLNMNLREEKHWSYGARTVLLGTSGPRPYLGFAPVQSDKTAEALAEFTRELRGIRGERPVTADELHAAQSNLTLSLPGQWETARAVAGSIGEIVRFRLGDDYFAGYADRVRAVTLADVAEAARLLQPSETVWVVVGDRAKVEAGLKALGLGDPRLLDADGRPLPPGTVK